MRFFIIGVSHHHAPVAIREKFVGLSEAERFFYDRSTKGGVLDETLIISTCNRLEILAVSRHPDAGRQVVLDTLAEAANLPAADFQPYLHEFHGLEAARHLFRVAGSLDSLVLGEPQILGQVKDAFRQALAHRRSGPFLNKLMHKCFRAAKRVRSETSLAGGAVSVAGAAVALARRLSGGQLDRASTLLLGAGPMAALAAANLRKRPLAGLTIMNRTQAKAEILAQKHQAVGRPWEELDQALAKADLVIAATGAPNPVLTFARLDPIMRRRPDRPLTIIDIGVPRNAAHDVKHLPQVALRNIDDLNEVVWESRAARQEAARRAETIIEEEVAKFGQWLKTQASRPTVTALTRKAERIRRLEVERTLSQHDFSPAQAEALEVMTEALVRRLLHDPLAFIKRSIPNNGREACLISGGCQPQSHCLHSIRQAFKIECE